MDAYKLTPRDEDFSEWYTQTILRSELADYAPVRGCMVVRPYGWSLWENIQSALNVRFKATGHKNAAFPLFIPQSFLEKEKDHVEGFSPELAVVTIAGGRELEEPLVVRPTSETIIGYMYSKWIKSYRDLPILINQWNNAVRWEMRTKLFLRTAEFYWQEGHTAHATAEESETEARQMLDVYTDFAVNEAAIPVKPGRKSEMEKFAGALRSYSIEAMMGDTKALQAATSHNLGQNFAKAFDIRYLDQNNNLQYCWTTSWGLSTRFIGAIIMTHGDDRGLILPPKLAPIQVVIVPIYRDDKARSQVMPVVEEIRTRLKDFRVEVDDRQEVTAGFKFNDWELRGVPLRIEIGPQDVAKGSVVLARRDIPGKEGKSYATHSGIEVRVSEILTQIHNSMYERAENYSKSHIYDPESYDELKVCIEDGWAFSWWCGSSDCEEKVKEETKATTRCIPIEQPGGKGKCICCGKEATEKVYFSRAY